MTASHLLPLLPPNLGSGVVSSCASCPPGRQRWGPRGPATIPVGPREAGGGHAEDHAGVDRCPDPGFRVAGAVTDVRCCHNWELRHPPQPAQPRHTNPCAPQTRKQHQQEHRPQRPTESSDPTQYAKGRTGDCPGPRKETATRHNVTQGGCRCFFWGGERGGTATGDIVRGLFCRKNASPKVCWQGAVEVLGPVAVHRRALSVRGVGLFGTGAPGCVPGPPIPPRRAAVFVG